MYLSVNDHGERTTRDFNGQLYTACRDIVGETNGAVMTRTYTSARARLVAFWCAFDGIVKAGHGATDAERAAVKDFRLTA